MIRIEVSNNMPALKRRLRRLARNIQALDGRTGRQIYDRRRYLAQRALRRLTQQPGPPRYPIRWKSRRQRRAFFATKGFGRGIPTRRTGGLVAGWQVRYSKQGQLHTLTLANPVPSMQFVQGQAQQPFHKDTGWARWDTETGQFVKESSDAVVQGFFAECEWVMRT